MEPSLVMANSTQVLLSLCIFFKSVLAVITSYSSPNGFRIKSCFSRRDTQIVWNTKKEQDR